MRHAPLVLLHGFTGGPASFDATVQHLRTYRSDRTFAPYLLGHGPGWASRLTKPTTRSSSFEAEVSNLGNRLSQAGVSESNAGTVVGYSLGARMALGLLVSFPNWFRRGVLIGVNPGISDPSLRQVRRREDEQRAVALERDGMDAFLTSWQAQGLFDTQKTLAGEVLQRQAALRRANTPAGLAHSLRSVGLAAMPDYTPKLGAITTPVVLAVGQHDAKFRSIATNMHGALAVSELVIVPHVGHNIPLEAPQPLAELLDSLPEDT